MADTKDEKDKAEKKVRILVVDDEKVHRYTLCSLFEEWGWGSMEAADGVQAVEAVSSHSFDAVLMDVRMARMDGMEALRRIRASHPALPVIVMTAFSSVDSAVAAIKMGAQDYMTKPLDFERLRTTMEVVMGQCKPEDKSAPGMEIREGVHLIGQSEAMRDLAELIDQVAPTNATVLITGESGTGKELIAAALHHKSNRAGGPFIKINCAALTETLLESELFGHEKGAFTGADRRRDGRFVQAQGGTLFLDEIGDTTPAMQVKLLRALQEHEVQRVGGQETIRVDARILAATNRDLEEMVKEGKFREDLYYRLKVVELEAPPLRERIGDIPLLVDYFLDKFAKANNRVVKGLTPDCQTLFSRYPWPGNVRELEHALERGAILMRGEYVDVSVLPTALQRWDGKTMLSPRMKAPEPTTVRDAEKALILKTLEETGGNRSEAARRLEITRKTLLNKLKQYKEEGEEV